ncbi:MAG: PepSY domain-containing protein [Dongiaceae bacterium]
MSALAIAAAGLILAATGEARAEQSGNDAQQIKQAKISLTEAVAAAESKTGGRASKAEFERAEEGWVYDVEIVAGEVVSDVHVDAGTGTILSVSDDVVDNDAAEQDESD